ncbi:hypothetical protein [uncultured Nocardioides sp.]|uniref:hypothetical protein n=1 Tax=uncultured Nocardioides sp. TaxID=198441 RepID=UPI0026784F5D
MQDVSWQGHVLRVFLGLSLYAFFVLLILINPPARELLRDSLPVLVPLHVVGVGVGVLWGRRKLDERSRPASAAAGLAVGGALLLALAVRDSGAEELFVVFGWLPLSAMLGLNLGLAWLKQRRPEVAAPSSRGGRG